MDVLLRLQAYRHSARIAACLTATIFLSLVSTTASASSDSEARLLFREGRTLANNGYYEEACDKFEQSRRIESGIGTEFNLADCLEHLGKTASARALFLNVALSAQAAGQSLRADVALERADRLQLRLSRLQIRCIDSCPVEPRVFLGDTEILRKSWSEPMALDPGTYRINTTTQSGTDLQIDVSVPQTPGLVIVEIPRGQSPAPAPSVIAPQPVTLTPSQLVPSQTSVSTSQTARPQLAPTNRIYLQSSSQSTVQNLLLLGGIGALAVGAGSSLALKYTNDRAKSICPSSEGCTETEIARHERLLGDAKAARVSTYASLSLGAAAISAYAIWRLGSGPRDQQKVLASKNRVAIANVSADNSHVSLFLSGSF